MREYTMRGTMAPTEVTRPLVVDDGRFTHGFIIEEMRIWSAGAALPTGFSSNACLSLYDTPPATMNAEESGTIAWSSWIENTTNGIDQFFIIDPEHVINQDLFLHNMGGTAMNYLIRMVPITMTPEQGVLQLVKAVNNNS